MRLAMLLKSNCCHRAGVAAWPAAMIHRPMAEHQIRIMVATDAACEGLNLQTLGTLINVDLPWNPTRLEQRIGRIKRFGQKRDAVDMLNLVNEQTVDEKIYDRLSDRMRDRTTCSARYLTRSKTNGSMTSRRWAKRWTTTSTPSEGPQASTCDTRPRWSLRNATGVIALRCSLAAISQC